MQRAKIIVIAMGVLILVMFGAVIYGIIQKAGPQPALQLAASLPPPPFTIALPELSHISSIASAPPYLAVLMEGPEGEVIYLVDPVRKSIAGTIKPSKNN